MNVKEFETEITLRSKKIKKFLDVFYIEEDDWLIHSIITFLLEGRIKDARLVIENIEVDFAMLTMRK